MKPKPALPTSDEVDRRLRIVSELRNLCLSLGQAGQSLQTHTPVSSPTHHENDESPAAPATARPPPPPGS